MIFISVSLPFVQIFFLTGKNFLSLQYFHSFSQLIILLIVNKWGPLFLLFISHTLLVALLLRPNMLVKFANNTLTNIFGHLSSGHNRTNELDSLTESHATLIGKGVGGAGGAGGVPDYIVHSSEEEFGGCREVTPAV